MKKASLAVLPIMIGASIALAACSASTPPPPAPTVTETVDSTAKGGARHKEITIRATVEKVDVKNRKVTLKGFDGTVETIQVGDEVRNLPQMKKGDQVVVTYLKSVAFEVVKKSDAELGVTGAAGAGRAELGEKPGAVGAKTIQIVADIVKLDRANSEAVLKTANGEVFSVEVQNAANFDKVKVGDRVAIQLTEGVAIDVQPAGAK
jgi:hypothetical protein